MARVLLLLLAIAQALCREGLASRPETTRYRPRYATATPRYHSILQSSEEPKASEEPKSPSSIGMIAMGISGLATLALFGFLLLGRKKESSGDDREEEETVAEEEKSDEPQPIWNLVFRQTFPELFSPGEWCKNPEDPSNPNFAILDRLEDFRMDGAFQFKLVWPGSGKEEQIWKQTSNPVRQVGGGVDGYEEISTPYTSKGWGGLEYSGTHALVDGSVSAGGWYYAIGAFYKWRAGFPGPDCAVGQAELYVYSVAPKSSMDTTQSISAMSEETSSDSSG